MRQTGHSLEKVHGQRRGAPSTFTSCGRRGFTTSRQSAITCKRCLAKGRPYESCPHLGTHFETGGQLHTRRLTRAGRIVCSACDANT